MNKDDCVLIKVIVLHLYFSIFTLQIIEFSHVFYFPETQSLYMQKSPHIHSVISILHTLIFLLHFQL